MEREREECVARKKETWRRNVAWLGWARGETDDKVRYGDQDNNDDDDDEKERANDWTEGSIFTKLSLLAANATIYLHLIPTHGRAVKILKCNKIQSFCRSGSGTIVLWRESEYPSNPDTSENCFNTNSADTFIWKTGLVIFCQYSIFRWNTAKTITWRGKYRRVWFYANNWKGQLPLCISEITYLFPFPKTLKEKCAQNQVLLFFSICHSMHCNVALF